MAFLGLAMRCDAMRPPFNASLSCKQELSFLASSRFSWEVGVREASHFRGAAVRGLDLVHRTCHHRTPRHAMPPPLHFQVRAVSCLNPRHMNRAADALRQYSLSPPETSAATPIFGARPVFRKTGEMVA